MPKKNGNGYSSHRKANKYHNHRTEVDGIIFASRKESEYYKLLKCQLAAGQIQSFEMQVPFQLIPDYVNAAGKKIRGMKYVCDFLIVDKDGKKRVVDVKGLVTDSFKLKKKLYE